MDEIPGLRTGISGHVYGSRNAQDTAVVSDKEHNLQTTVVWAFNILGMPMRPLVIEASGKRCSRKISRSMTKPGYFFHDFPEVMWTSTESSFITTEIFVQWLHDLRRYVGDSDPIFLISDGHTSRTNKDTIDAASELNIILFLIPANTSHALSPSDQFHQHLHRRRRLHDKNVRLQLFNDMTPDDKMESLLNALKDGLAMSGLMRAAWRHAGISLRQRSASDLRNKPAPDVVSASTASVGSPRSTVTPSLSQAPMCSPGTAQKHLIRLIKREQVNALSVAMVTSRRDAIRTARLAKRSAREHVDYVGRIDDVTTYEHIMKKKIRKDELRSKQARISWEKRVAGRVRKALNEDDCGSKLTVAELRNYLRNFHTIPTAGLKRPELLHLVAQDLGEMEPKLESTTSLVGDIATHDLGQDGIIIREGGNQEDSLGGAVSQKDSDLSDSEYSTNDDNDSITLISASQFFSSPPCTPTPKGDVYPCSSAKIDTTPPEFRSLSPDFQKIESILSKRTPVDISLWERTYGEAIFQDVYADWR